MLHSCVSVQTGPWIQVSLSKMSLDTMMVVDFLAQDNQADIFQDQVDKHGALLGKCDLYLKGSSQAVLWAHSASSYALF